MPRVMLSLTKRVKRPRPDVRAGLAYARRRFDADLDTALAMSHHPGVFWTWSRFEVSNGKLRSTLPDGLADLVVFVTAVRIGCSWCVDFGASLWERQGLDPAVLTDAVNWRSSSRFDPVARAAFAFAEALTDISADAADDEELDRLADELRRHVGEAGVVEVAYWAALENMRSRFNRSLGLTSQGFSSGEACAVATADAGGRGHR